MGSWHEIVKVNLSRVYRAYGSVDTLVKMKAQLPSLEKYTSPSCAEETFSAIYHWTFTYLREGGMRKVVDLEVYP
jgi:hypothetical protein